MGARAFADTEHAARRAAAARQPFWFAAQAVPSALGPAVGEKTAELPVEQVTKVELAMNLHSIQI
jgi:hypothetical protein